MAAHRARPRAGPERTGLGQAVVGTERLADLGLVLRRRLRLRRRSRDHRAVDAVAGQRRHRSRPVRLRRSSRHEAPSSLCRLRRRVPAWSRRGRRHGDEPASTTPGPWSRRRGRHRSAGRWPAGTLNHPGRAAARARATAHRRHARPRVVDDVAAEIGAAPSSLAGSNLFDLHECVAERRMCRDVSQEPAAVIDDVHQQAHPHDPAQDLAVRDRFLGYELLGDLSM